MESVVDEMRTDFDVPMLRVATDQEYQPRLDQIIDFVVRDHRTRQHAINSPLWTRSGAPQCGPSRTLHNLNDHRPGGDGRW
jgi:hypothetical protein